MALYPKIKRALDILFLLGTAIFWIPLVCLLAGLVRFKMGPGIFYRQQRPGRDGKVFLLLKFRTMTEERDSQGVLLPDEQRLTPFGRWLRFTSMDELPEFINVLKGEMSLIGPRPLLVKYLDRYTPEQRRRHQVRPGMTGWAQVNGRNATTWEERLKLDIWYVDHLSFWLDLKILFATLKSVWAQEGIDAPGRVGMEEFQGSPQTTNSLGPDPVWGRYVGGKGRTTEYTEHTEKERKENG